MDVRAACALAGALVHAAVQAKAPRRTTAAVAAAAFAAAQRGLRSDAAACPAAAGEGPPGAAPPGGGAAAALRAARAAARKRRKAAAKARKLPHLVVNEGDAEMAEPPGEVEAPGPPPHLPRDDRADAALVLPGPVPTAATPPLASSSAGGAAPAGAVRVVAMGTVKQQDFGVGVEVIVAGSDFEGAAGCITFLEPGGAIIEVRARSVYHDAFPITVPLHFLVPSRCGQPDGARVKRRRGKQKR
mmetsp:Transcript_79514/g.224866  ORF Transcript_79514/g.224866 Transcript_79514/m.224866 type:complete len:244 (-) Transcript_79514:21-752(-)